MLRNTFLHIPGISRNTETMLWQNDILNWDDFSEKKGCVNLTKTKKEKISHHLEKSEKAYDEKNHFFFSSLPSNTQWRAYPDFRKKCCFLDIETTGLDKRNDDITVIGLHDGEDTKLFIKGKNLEKFKKEIKKYSLLVTFNGRCFDVPFIKSKFPELDMNKLHIDLRFALKELNYSGGLKRIEKQLRIKRDDELEGIDGFEAVRLWHRYLKGDNSALNLLLEYNKADVENLKTMMAFAYNKLKEKNFLSLIDKQ